MGLLSIPVDIEFGSDRSFPDRHLISVCIQNFIFCLFFLFHICSARLIAEGLGFGHAGNIFPLYERLIFF
jgi:hypothetical protein